MMYYRLLQVVLVLAWLSASGVWARPVSSSTGNVNMQQQQLDSLELDYKTLGSATGHVAMASATTPTGNFARPQMEGVASGTTTTTAAAGAARKLLQEGDDGVINAAISHEYYDVNVRHRHNHSFGWEDIRTTGILAEGVSNTDDGPPFQVVNTTWLFPFYGHWHQEVYISPNGFVMFPPALHCQEGFCNWGAASPDSSLYIRYIAPLMTDLNPGAFNSSTVHYLLADDADPDTGPGRLIVQWSNVTLYTPDLDGLKANFSSFTFQAMLWSNGEIAFNYLDVPFNPRERELVVDDSSEYAEPIYYPLTVGIEDAVEIQQDNYVIVAPYKAFDIPFEHIAEAYGEGNGRSIHFVPRETCLDYTDSCTDCLNFTKTMQREGVENALQCGWCPDVSMCTDSVGREVTELTDNCLNEEYLLDTLAFCGNISEYYGEREYPEENNPDNSVAELVAGCIVGVAAIMVIVYVGLRFKDRSVAMGGYQDMENDATLPYGVSEAAAAPASTNTVEDAEMDDVIVYA